MERTYNGLRLARNLHGHLGQRRLNGAHWHARKEVIELFQEAGLPRPTISTVIYFPFGSLYARLPESMLPKFLPWGGFMLAVCDCRRINSNN